MWLPLAQPLLGTWSAAQACALTGNQTSDPVVHRPVLSTLSYTSQGYLFSFLTVFWCIDVFNVDEYQFIIFSLCKEKYTLLWVFFKKSLPTSKSRRSSYVFSRSFIVLALRLGL